MLDHNFNRSRFTVGIEEELMLLDPDTLDLTDGIETILAAVPPDYAGQVKPELFQSVLEVATRPCADVAEATAQLAEMRRLVCALAAEHGMLVGAAGTHPFARCDDQSIVNRDRYVDLIGDLGYIASRELIFGTHVHVGINDPERAIYVADGIRRHLPLLLALSSNSPWWEGRRTNLHSSRTPVFRAFPRAGIPPHYGSWEIYSRRIARMIRSGAIDDYTYVWWDVRPHPRLGTVETRVFDQATRLEDTAAFAALTVSLAHRLAASFDAGDPLIEVPWELIDDNKVRACVHGIEGELVDFNLERPVAVVELTERLLAEVEPSAAELGCLDELGRVREILVQGTGSLRQIDWVDRRGGEDLRGLVEAVVALTAPDPS